MGKNYIFVLLVLVFANYTAVKAQKHGSDTAITAVMQDCEDFTDAYQPTYIRGTDTLLVSAITMPPDYMNKFLFNCIKTRNYAPLKYAAAIFVKQHNEYMKINHQDYQLEDSTYVGNGFVELLRAAMGLGRNEAGVQNIEELTTGDVCDWIDAHAKKIQGFEYVKQFEK